MEQLEVFDCSNVFIASYFTDDRDCMHENREHTLLYLYSGELEIEERGKKTILHEGDYAFMRRDNQMWLQKHCDKGKTYRSVVLKFSKAFLREFYQKLNRREIPTESKRERTSLHLLPKNRPDIRSLFESVIPYFESATKPLKEVLILKMVEGVYILLNVSDRGFLGGCINECTRFDPTNDNRQTLPRFQPEAIQANTRIVNALQAFGCTRGMTSAQVALAWLLQKAPWIVPIPGTTKLSHLEENLRSLEFAYTPDEWQELERTITEIPVVGDRYNAEQRKQVGF